MASEVCAADPVRSRLLPNGWQATHFKNLQHTYGILFTSDLKCRSRIDVGTGGAPPEPVRDQAAMNSFHLRTMYWFSSITEFQQATRPMRSSNEPPSRTSPACAMA